MAHQGSSVEEMTIAQIHQAMLAGNLTARRLVEAYLERIAEYDKQGPALNSVILVNSHALDLADELDEKIRYGLTGPLHGIPILLKDNVNTADMPTTGGSVSLAGFVPEKDAFIVQRMKEAGAIILAKTNLHEFAVWGETVSSILGQTLNPYDLSRSPGGSSGGTGAAVAANFGAAGIGTDTVNSVRSPASANCLVGVRPTVGLVSRGGIIPYSLTQDTAGPITRTVTDAAILLDVMAGCDPEDAITRESQGKIPDSYTSYLQADGLTGKKLGVIRSFFGREPEHAEVNQVMAQALGSMRSLGAELVDIDELFDANALIAQVSVHLHDFQDHLNEYLAKLGSRANIHSMAEIVASGGYHPGIGDNLRQAMQLTTQDSEYQERLTARRRLQEQLQRLMDVKQLDGLVYPHQKRLVVPVGQPQVDRNGVLAAVTGFPAVTVPAGLSRPTKTAPLGVPVGIEFLGRPWAEPLLFSMTYAFEQATCVRKPPVFQPL